MGRCVHITVLGSGLEKMFISLQAGQNFPPAGQISFQCGMVSLMYFFIFSLQITKFPGKELPVLPIFSTPGWDQKHLALYWPLKWWLIAHVSVTERYPNLMYTPTLCKPQKQLKMQHTKSSKNVIQMVHLSFIYHSHWIILGFQNLAMIWYVMWIPWYLPFMKFLEILHWNNCPILNQSNELRFVL